MEMTNQIPVQCLQELDAGVGVHFHYSLYLKILIYRSLDQFSTR